MKYTVHIYAIVRVKRMGIEADSQDEAMKKAEGHTDFNALFSSQGNGDLSTEYAEDIDSFLVDEEDDLEYKNSQWYDRDYKPI